MKKILSKIVLILILFTAWVFFIKSQAVAQSMTFPIPELGYCNSVQSCQSYCETAQNHAACWSYGKYILKKSVLGAETTSPEEEAKKHGITFPIAELGNCGSASACMNYCNQPQNQNVCLDFGKKKGLTKEINSVPPSVNKEKLVADAKNLLGCSDEVSCKNFCSSPSNRQKCEEFAKKEGLMRNDNMPSPPSPPPGVFEATKSELGCDSISSCQQYCQDANHFKQCQEFATKHNLMPNNPKTEPKEFNQENNGKFQNNNFNSQNNARDFKTPKNFNQPSNNPPASACKNEQECNDFCKNNPSSCPGFPKKPEMKDNPAMQNPVMQPTTTQNFPGTQNSNEHPQYSPSQFK